MFAHRRVIRHDRDDHVSALPSLRANVLTGGAAELLRQRRRSRAIGIVNGRDVKPVDPSSGAPCSRPFGRLQQNRCSCEKELRLSADSAKLYSQSLKLCRQKTDCAPSLRPPLSSDRVPGQMNGFIRQGENLSQD